MARKDIAFEQTVLRAHSQIETPIRRVLLAVSGGCDSMVMAEVVNKWRKGLKIELGVAHVHHGTSQNRKQSLFRSRAQKFVQSWAVKRKLPFHTNPTSPPTRLNSEQEYRVWREHWLKTWAKDQGYDTVAMAHHQDDLLETRLIRLVRGSGAQGIRAMRYQGAGRWRPLLPLLRQDIEDYATARQIEWIEDPSNKQDITLRNWMRREWLPLLESRSPGAKLVLSRSLEKLVPRWTELEALPYVGLRRAELMTAPAAIQREMVARYLKSLGIKGYQSTHVNEILKRMKTSRVAMEPQRVATTFMMLGLKIHFSRDLVWASRV